ncbi:MAG: hypothetical protein AB7O49_04310 [Sphingomonadales bacterium]
MKQPAASWVGAIALGLMLAIGSANAADKKASIDEMVAAAKTSEDHNAIAAAYDEEAAYLDKKAAMHEKLAQLYKNAPANPKGASNMHSHCTKIVQDFKETAKLDRELAEHHRAMGAGHH